MTCITLLFSLALTVSDESGNRSWWCDSPDWVQPFVVTVDTTRERRPYEVKVGVPGATGLKPTVSGENVDGDDRALVNLDS